MTWTLVSRGNSDVESQRYHLKDGGIARIALINTSLGVVREISDGMMELGLITSGPWGAKIEAIGRPLTILSGQPSVAPQFEKYQLQERTNERPEILLLRHGDVITSSFSVSSVTFIWESVPEAQVNSSAAGVNVDNPNSGIAATPEEETEDEDGDNDLNITTTAVVATQSKSQQPEATPQLSNQQSVIIQETPTAGRVSLISETEAIPMTSTHDILESYSTAPTAQSKNLESKGLETSIDFMGAPPKDTPHVGRHPRVMISKKRPSPVFGEASSGGQHTSRSSKRAKKMVQSDDDSQNNRPDEIMVNAPEPPETNNKKGKSAVKRTEDFDEGTPSRSQRNSQRSNSAASAKPYLGETPCIATSNSTITEKSQAVKFLKKQGGSLVDSVKQSFNVLCVRDGSLQKTPKVLQAIATGTPIVTDRWLTDSAKAGHFVSTDAYTPSAPKQEVEWKFKLQDVIGNAQKPFKGYTIHFTTSLVAMYNDFSEIEQVCKAAGAEKVTKKKKKIDKSATDIVLGAEEGDKDSEKLMQEGFVCYNRDLLPMSIFRGRFDFESEEFKISAGDTDANLTEDNKSRKRTKT
ncbi:hypothetical protein GQ44DRAFT_686540 [Phaeosphaeriaceae sp. PMI808]|nr:hypothetical protein GQ44DRAFT_686540 [Phaeosphaeriaceae sp. PMI808]